MNDKLDLLPIDDAMRAAYTAADNWVIDTFKNGEEGHPHFPMIHHAVSAYIQSRTAAPLPEDKQKALDALNKVEWCDASCDGSVSPGYDCDDASDYLTKHHKTIRASLQTPSVPVSVADELFGVLSVCERTINPQFYSQLSAAIGIAIENYNNFKQEASK